MSFNTTFEHEVQISDVLLRPIRDFNLRLDSVDLSSIVEVEENGEDEDAFSSLWQYCNTTPNSLQSNQGAECTGTVRNTRDMTSLPSFPPVDNNEFLTPLPLNDDFMAPPDKTAIDNALSDIMPDPLPTVQFASTRHPGNNRFYLLLQMHRHAFLKASEIGSSVVCDQIALKIMDSIYTQCVPAGRFLEVSMPNSNKTSYKVLNPQKEVIDIVKWALREPPKPELARYFQKSCSASSFQINKNVNYGAIVDERNDKSMGGWDGSCSSWQSKKNQNSSFRVSFPPRSSLGSNSDYISSESSGQSNYSNNSLTSCNFQWNSRMKKQRRRRDKKGVRFKKGEGEKEIPLKRRGTISSVGKEKGGNKKDFNLADRRFSIATPLSKLVEEAQKTRKDTASTCISDNSGTNSKGTVNRLGSQIGHFNIQDSTEETQTNKTSLFENEEAVPTFVKTLNGVKRSLCQYDILCETPVKLHREKSIGTFRLRTMLQMNKATFHKSTTTKEEKKAIINCIIKNIMNYEARTGLFVEEKNGMWHELAIAKVNKLIELLMENCLLDPNLQLPSLQEAFARSLTLTENKAIYQKLHSNALSSMKNKRRKKKIRDFDPDYVNCLQSSVMLEKRQRK